MQHGNDPCVAMRRPETPALYATIIVGVITALAPVIPLPLRATVLPAAIVGWLAAIAVVLVRAVRRRRQVHSHLEVAFAVIGIIGIALAILAMVELSLVRIVTRRDALLWNVDWRFALAHAQSIAKSGGLESATDFAGYPIQYHLGSAWLAGMWGYTFGSGVIGMLFGALPFAATLSFVFASVSLLTRAHISIAAAIFATGATMTLPVINPYSLAAHAVDMLSDPGWRPFGIDLRLNQSFGLAVGMSALALLYRHRAYHDLALGTVGLASLIVIKPQCFIGFGTIVAVTSCSRLSTWRPDLSRYQTALYGVAIALACVFVVIPIFPDDMGNLIPHLWLGVGSLFALAVICCFSTASTSVPRSSAILVAGASAFGLALAAHRLLPGAPDAAHQSVSLVWDAVPPSDYDSLATFVFLCACVAWFRRANPAADRHGFQLARHMMLSVVLLLLGLYWTRFHPGPELATRMAQFQGTNETGQSFFLRRQVVVQMLAALWLAVGLASFGVLATLALHAAKRITAIAFGGVVAALALSALCFLIPHAIDPRRGNEMIEDVGLYRTLSVVPTRGTLLIANDIADPAEGYRRVGGGAFLAAYFGHSFYVANLRYHRWMLPEAPSRLDELQRFFSNPWSPGHLEWLHVRGITHVLVSQRCPPAWDRALDLPLTILASSAKWEVYRVPPPPSLPPADVVPLPSARARTPRWGIGRCLGMVPT